MFIGHYAVGLAAKKAAPKISLGTLFLSVQWLDLLWPIFLLLGMEHFRISPGSTAYTPYDFYDYPTSHSLLTTLAYSFAFGVVYYLIQRSTKAAWIIGFGVLSHWILDVISHRPDMPIAPGLHTYVGLGLWNSVPATVIVEAAMFILGLVVYLRSTKAVDRIGSYAFWSLIALLAFFWAGSIFYQSPMSESSTAFGALSMWLIVPWAYWTDRHRRSVTDRTQPSRTMVSEAN